jgi:hypothetical protein
MRIVGAKKCIAVALLVFGWGLAVQAQSWKFGVMADTQWSQDDGKNPNSVAVSIVKAVNQEFIKHKVDFVIQVGDLVDKTGSTPESAANAEDVRAVFSQELFNAGIGFFPLRGNHDALPAAGAEFRRIYPQTQNGRMSAMPSNVFAAPNPDAATQPFPVPSGDPFTQGVHFSTPDPSSTGGRDWVGLSYAFTYKNARFLLLDQFAPPNQAPGGKPDLTIDPQQKWIESSLSDKPAAGHAFVFGHKGIISENHKDTLFGKDPSANPAAQDAFIDALFSSGVRYYLQGHDHMHNRSLVSVTAGTPLDGKSAKVENIVCASDSHKFYTPNVPANDDTFDLPAFGHKRQAQISQDLHKVGYYVFTVDGPRVTGKYYAAIVSNAVPAAKCKLPSPEMCEYTAPTMPELKFEKAETFGYSLNGKEFLVCQQGQEKCNSSYTQVADSYKGTSVKILSGANNSKEQDFDKRPLIKTVNTGWTDKQEGTLSNLLTLWGVGELGKKHSEQFVLLLSYDAANASKGAIALSSKGKHGEWVNAVENNTGGAKKFVNGPWKTGYPLGSYGIDRKTKTAWAVLDHDGDFAVALLHE